MTCRATQPATTAFTAGTTGIATPAQATISATDGNGTIPTATATLASSRSTSPTAPNARFPATPAPTTPAPAKHVLRSRELALRPAPVSRATTT